MSEEKILSAEEILNAPDLAPVLVKTPEWGGSVYVRPLESWEQDDWERKLAEAKEAGEFLPSQARARIAVIALCRQDGTPLFTPAQLKGLSKKNSAPVNRIVEKILEISGMKQGAVEDAEKNSDSGPADNSGSN